MVTTLNIDVADYLSHEEIKELVRDQLRSEIQSFFRDEKNAQRLLSNLSYQIVFDEIDKIVPNSQKQVVDMTIKVLGDMKSYTVFRDGSYGGTPSLAHKYMEAAVVDNKALISQKVRDTITSKDYSNEIWSKFEALGETFVSNIYEITRLGRDNKSANL